MNIGETISYTKDGQNYNTGNLTANPKQLHDYKYTSLECGNLNDVVQYTIQGIHMESKMKFQLQDVL